MAMAPNPKSHGRHSLTQQPSTKKHTRKAEDNKAKANALRKILGEERFSEIEQNYSSNNRPWGTYRTAPWWAGAQGTFQNRALSITWKHPHQRNQNNQLRQRKEPGGHQ